MIEITSLNNEIVKDTVKLQQKKYREHTGKFLLEGAKCVQEAIACSLSIDKVFVLKDKFDKYDYLNQDVILTNSAVLKKISTTDSTPEIVAIAYQPQNDLHQLRNSRKVILLENISDAGNLGTIIRTASAFNIDSVVLYGETVDIYNPKCVRSTVGNLWKTNIVSIKTIDELKKYFNDYEIVATLPKTEHSTWLRDWIPSEQTLVMFGTESTGLSDELKSIATKNLTIEMGENVESLNLSISAGIIMYKML